MKTIYLNFKIIFLLLLIPLLPKFMQGQAFCSINAGGNITICSNADTIKLFGNISNDIDASTIAWSQTAGSPTYTILNGSNLNAAIIAPTAGFTAGTYTFQLSGNCTTNNTTASNTVQVTITSAPTTAIIQDVNGNAVGDTITVCRNLKLYANTLAVGENNDWFIDNYPSSLSWSDYGDSIYLGYGPASSCTYRTVYLRNSNGGCESIDTVVIEFLRQAKPNFQTVGGIGVSGYGQFDTVSICGPLTLNVTLAQLGCSGSVQSIGILPLGTGAPAIQLSPTVYQFTFPGAGTYRIGYKTNATAPCFEGKDELYINLCEDNNIAALGGHIYSRFCDSFPDTLVLNATNVAGYNYAGWSSSPSSGVTITPTTGQSAIAVITNQSPSSYTFWNNITKQDTCWFNNKPKVCSTQRRYTLAKVQRIATEGDTANYLCGTQSNILYRPSQHFSFTSGAAQPSTRVEVITSPNPGHIGNFHNINSLIPLNLEGQYIFQVTSWNTEGGVRTCEDTALLVVNIADLQNPNAGSDVLHVCKQDTIELVGSDPIDQNGIINNFVVNQWNPLPGNPGVVTFYESPNDRTPKIGGFSVAGNYFFEYVFLSEDSECYLADTVMIQIDSICNRPCDLEANLWVSDSMVCREDSFFVVYGGGYYYQFTIKSGTTILPGDWEIFQNQPNYNPLTNSVRDTVTFDEDFPFDTFTVCYIIYSRDTLCSDTIEQTFILNNCGNEACDTLDLNAHFSHRIINGTQLNVSDQSTDASIIDYITWSIDGSAPIYGAPGSGYSFYDLESGYHEICLEITTLLEDNLCCKKTLCEKIFIPELDTCEKIDFTANYNWQYDEATGTITFEDNSSPTPSVLVWTLPDGSQVIGDASNPNISTLQYDVSDAEPGSNFTVCLKAVLHISDDICCVSEFCDTIVIPGEDPCDLDVSIKYFTEDKIKYEFYTDPDVFSTYNVVAYDWTFTPGGSSSDEKPTYEFDCDPEVETKYKVCLYLKTVGENIECDTLVCIDIIVPPCPEQESRFIAYPNPTSQLLTLKNTNNKGKVEVQIENTLGRSISKESFSGESFVLDMSPFKAGIYILRIKSDNGDQVIKITKK